MKSVYTTSPEATSPAQTYITYYNSTPTAAGYNMSKPRSTFTGRIWYLAYRKHFNCWHVYRVWCPNNMKKGHKKGLEWGVSWILTVILSLIIITHWLCDIIPTTNLYYWSLLMCLYFIQTYLSAIGTAYGPVWPKFISIFETQHKI